MRNYFLHIALLWLTLCTACNRNTVSLSYTNANEEVKQLENLVFRFNRPLVKDSLLNRWDSTEYVLFEPAIPGRFRWESPDQLVFSPLRPLSPATTYSATLRQSLLAFSDYDKLEKQEKLRFHTPGLQMETPNITWVLADERTNTPLPQLELYFNYPVDQSVLKEKLQVNAGNRNLSYSVITASASEKITLRIMDLKAEDRDQDIEIRVEKGMLPLGGKNPLEEPIVSKAVIPSPYVLTINSVETEHDGSTGKIIVKTSQQVATGGLDNLIKIDPKVPFNTEITDDGFIISGSQFDMEKSYELILEKGIRGRIGGQLKEDHISQLAFGQMAPSISFTNNKAIYLSAQGNRNIEIRIVNSPKVKVVVSRIYENNLLASQRYGYYPREENNPNEEDYYYDGAGDATLGDIIYEKEIDTRSLPKNGSASIFNFNIEDRLPEMKGLYHIKVRSTEDYWLSDSRFISLSDIGLITKEGRDKVFVFANSIKTSQPLKGVQVLAYGANNQVLGMATTGEDGMAAIEHTRKDIKGFRPLMVIAKTANDFNYIHFNQSAVNTSRFEVGGKRSNSTGLDAFVYGERDIFRPGEKINFGMIVRDQQWKSPGEIPIKFKVLLPTGKELTSFRKTLNAEGGLEASFAIANEALTGSYNVEVYTGNDVLLTSKAFMVEEFVPDRIKLTTKTSKQELQPSENTDLDIEALNFFGPPAAGRKYEVEVQLKQRTFVSKNFPRYNFALANQNGFFDKKLFEGNTDNEGKARINFEVPEMYKNIGLLQADFFTTVFDETGRPVSRKSEVKVLTQDKFIGIGADGYDYYPLNQDIGFPIVAVNKDDQLLNNVQVKVEVIKHEYRTVLTKSDGYFRYNSQEEDKILSSQVVQISGDRSRYNFKPVTPGNYEIRVSLPGAGTYVSRSFYSYGHWGSGSNDFEVDREGQIEISLDKAEYKPGDDVKILFKTPFSGRMLVTLEKDQVIHHQYIQVDKRSASLDLRIKEEHLPNIYVTATLIKAHDVSEIPLTVAHGFKSITVKDNRKNIPVEIIAKEKSRSRTRQKVTVKAEAGSMITLAAVDNGVLQVTDFESPDPYKFFYSRRALEVNSYDMYALLYPEIQARRSSTGGDGGARMDQRVNPMPNKRIKILSYWSGIAKANGSGEASFEFDIPQFSGEVRLMAVVYKNDCFGASSKTMKVADPMVLSTALPRFLSPGDTVNVPVTISNTTAKSATAKASIELQGPLEIVGNSQSSTTVNANSEGRVEFKIAAKRSIAPAKVVIKVQGAGENFVEETDITVRPASTLQKKSGSGIIAGKSNKTIQIETGDFIPSGVKYQLVVSRSPALELGSQLQYLIQYPYGCTEQTISTAFPQLYFSELSGLIQAGKNSTAAANNNVLEAIRQVKMRQLYSGAVTMWDNAGTENWWATAYAGHFLLEARKAGFDVDPALLESILNYINNRLSAKTTINYYYNRDQQRKIAPKEVPYSLYVLSLAGRPNISTMNYYSSRPELLAIDGKYLLSAAFALGGDKSKLRELMPGSFAGEESVPQTGGSFYSDIRDEALALNALLSVEPAHPQVPQMARHVAAKLKARRWYSTQESSFALLAMGKLAAMANRSSALADITVNGKTVAKINNNSVRLDARQLGGNQVTIQSKGDGSLYYWWEAEGISASGQYTEEDNFLKIRRKFFDRNGRTWNGNHFKQNDLVIVQLTLEKSYSGTLENIVLTDLLPAGFEIENPRTKEIPGMEWIKDGWDPVALDVRDDRIHFFVDATAKKQVYYYAVRAVSTGDFQIGPASADAMYNNEYHSYHGGGIIVVE